MSAAQSNKPLPELKPTASGDAIYRGLGNVARVIYRGLLKLEIEGADNLPRSQGYIVISNHLSEMDPVTVAYPVFTTGTLPRFLAKESLFRAPGLGWILRKLAHIPVARGSVDARKSLETAQNVVNGGGAVIIYPEGTLTKDPQGWPMSARTGAARLALATGAPVIPIAHWGDQDFLPPHSKPSFFPRKKVRVKVGQPLDLTQLITVEEGKKYSRAELVQVTDFMLDTITDLLVDIRGEQAPQGRFNPATGQRETRG
ncbi:lysophospholipid acyltransferase family protein [uncultured Rothia sp.]|uniref:lysophospholipid acyltransferase family protein n=1 Tax=uncultured Rothia sp. TaxID=316088 RepID=UPI003217ABF7